MAAMDPTPRMAAEKTDFELCAGSAQVVDYMGNLPAASPPTPQTTDETAKLIVGVLNRIFPGKQPSPRAKEACAAFVAFAWHAQRGDATASADAVEHAYRVYMKVPVPLVSSRPRRRKAVQPKG
jgi:hypothetical protein